MPRTRKTRTARASVEPFWKIGLYIRLSREDDNEDDSESIINQENICQGGFHQKDEIPPIDWSYPSLSRI